MTTIENGVALGARLLMSVLFIAGGWGKLVAAAATQAYFAKEGLPVPELAWIVAVIVELGGGIAILLGIFARPVALILALWCIATALIAHSDFALRAMQIHFMKNLAMAGGFLYVALFGAGAWSLDALPARRRQIAAPR